VLTSIGKFNALTCGRINKNKLKIV